MTKSYQIVSPALTVQALRDSGYKSTAHALAELIDNGVEAGASVVEVFAVEEPEVAAGGTRHRINRIGVLDNGSGMDADVLRRALRFGDGTRQARQSIGRFGMGLPNSSMSQCRHVDVWSWTNGPDNALHTYLDIPKIEGGMLEVPEPAHSPVPEEWRHLSEALDSTGTLVVWSELDRVQWRGAKSTLKNTEFLIGRVYRKWLTTGEVRIRLVPVREGESTIDAIDARPNDPLYLTQLSSTPPPFGQEPMFEPFGASSTGVTGVETFKITHEGGTHSVIVRASIARDVARRPDLDDTPWPQEYRARQPGSTPWGKHAGHNAGISLIRARRELDLDGAWVIDYDPAERFWGVEVEFPPELDEVFGVTNNKQTATIFTSLAHFKWKEEADQNETYHQFVDRLKAEGDRRIPLIGLVYHLREKLLPALRRALEAQTRGTRKNRKRYDKAAVKADDAVKQRTGEGHTGLTDDLAERKTPEEIRQEQLDSLMSHHRFSREDAEKQIEEIFADDRQASMVTTHQNSPGFFDVEFKPALLLVALNMNHAVYKHLIAVLDTDTDGLDRDEIAERLEQAAIAFKVLLFSWARFEDELPPKSRERVQGVRWDWGRMATRFLDGDDEDD